MRTYDDRCSAKYSGIRTGEAVSMIRRAKVLDVGEHPCLYAELYSAGNDSCNDLTPEHRTMWDLHVMPKLEVTCECKCLQHSIISPCLEQHHSDWAAREGVSNNQLCDDIKPNLLIRSGLYQPGGDRVYKCWTI
jgi:hypothetical protein